MQYSFAALALAALAAANPMPAGVTSAISPSKTDPAGCSSSYDGKFEIEVVNVTTSKTKRDLAPRSTPLVLTLNDGVLKDAEGRTGYIASNYQFQFDDPPQAGAIYTSGWSACSNKSLALGDSAIFYECLSGTFYNLYDESTGAQCSKVYIDILADGSSSGAASVGSDGQATATGAASQISDGQVTASAVSTTASAVTQISDGQIQATTGTSKTTSAAAVSQISDGQVQATTAKATTTSSAAAVSQISDGQIQATTASNATSTNSTRAATSTAAVYTGAAMPIQLNAEMFGLAAAGAMAAALF